MIAHTLTEQHPWHVQRTCTDCAGAGEYFCNDPIYGATVETCSRCGGRGSIYVPGFNADCDRCRQEQYQHEQHCGV